MKMMMMNLLDMKGEEDIFLLSLPSSALILTFHAVVIISILQSLLFW